MEEVITIGESDEPLKSGNLLNSNFTRLNLQSENRDLNGKLDDIHCVEVNRRVFCLGDRPGYVVGGQ